MLVIYTLTSEEISNRDRRIEEMIAIMAQGDISALGGLYELIRTDVYAFALSKLGRREDAEDITHDTFVRIWQNAPAYAPQGKPMAWILTVELNLIRRACQLEGRTVEMESLAEQEDSENFVEDVIQNEFLRELMRALTPDEREVVVLHVVSGRKHREIADLLGCPLSTVLSRYNRAMKKLQVLVKEGK